MLIFNLIGVMGVCCLPKDEAPSITAPEQMVLICEESSLNDSHMGIFGISSSAGKTKPKDHILLEKPLENLKDIT